MKKSCPIMLTTFFLLLASCTTTNNNGGGEVDPPVDPAQKEYSYQCSVTWDGYNPVPTFSDLKDSSKTSEEIASLFLEKHSRKVTSYPTNEQKGIKEHKVEYVLKEDSSYSLSSSSITEEFELENVDMNDEKVLNYLRAESLQDQYQALMATKGESHDFSHYTLHVSPYGDEQTSLILALDKDFQVDVSKYLLESDTYTFEYLLPGNTYYWKAISKTTNTEFDGGLFKINEDNVRFCNFDRVGNMRDLGGWKTGENTRIRYNMIFRGRNCDSLNVAQKDAITEVFGFKTQIDLRCDANTPIKVRICPNVNYYYMNTESIYNQAIERDLSKKAGVCETPDEDNGRRLMYSEIIAKIFNVLSKEDNYPLYFHCIHGADRTGTLAFLIEGLLGVSLDDIIKDYELTSFSSKSGQRLRGKANGDGDNFELPLVDASDYGFQHMLEVINKEEGETLKDKIESFLTSEKIGVDPQDIVSIRNILIEQL